MHKPPNRRYPSTTQKNAKSLRQDQTDVEGLLWYYLRDKNLVGHKFRRQQPVGKYIVDFACLPQKLIVELDGGQHAEQRRKDETRDAWLRKKGYRVLRFWNNEVLENCHEVLTAISDELPPAA